MYADDSVWCCLFPQKCNLFHRATPEPAASFGAVWLMNVAAAVFVGVSVICIVGWRMRHRWFWKKTHGTKTTDDNITVDAVASGSVDKTYTDSSSSGFSNKINGESTAVEVLSEKESDYNSDWDIFEETIIRDVNLETKSGQKCEHQLCCKISFLVKKGSSINTSSSGSRTSEGGSRENHSNTSTACKPVVDDGDSHDENERHTTEMAGPSEKDVCDHDLEFIAFRKIRFKLCKNAEQTMN